MNWFYKKCSKKYNDKIKILKIKRGRENVEFFKRK